MTEEAKEARRLYAAKWREKNREAYNAYSRKWASDNPDRIREYRRRYWEKKGAQLQNVVRSRKN